MANCKDDLSDITSKNIIMVNLKEVPKEARKTVEEHMRAI
jgi:uncharacterized membrane protein